jgi:cobalt-zinc-cadmium efflux system outer membrane protein
VHSAPDRRAPGAVAPWLAVLLAGGCAVPVPDVEPQAAIRAAVPDAGALEFRREGAPLDDAGADPRRLEPDEAVRLALQGDPALAAALARVDEALAVAVEAGLPPDPVLSVVLRDSGDAPLEVEAGLAASLVALLRTPERAGVAHDRLRAEASRALATALDLLAEVQARYVEAQALDEARDVLARREANAVRLLDAAQARLDAGAGPRVDVTALQAERLALEIEAAELDGRRRRARLALARLVGRPSGAAEWELPPLAAPSPTFPPEDACLAAALRSRPDVQAAEWELLALGGEVPLAAGSVLEPGTLGLEAEKQGDWTFGPGVALPLPVPGRARARAAAAAARRAEALHLLSQARRLAVEEVRSAHAARHAAAGSLLRVESELIPLLEQRRMDVQLAFERRELDLTPLLRADQALQAALASRIELRQRAAEAQIRLQRAVGGPAALQAAAAPPPPGGHGDG